MTDIRALVLNCTLKPALTDSSTELNATQVLDQLRGQGADGEIVRVVDQRIAFGVNTDEGDGDGWPAVRQKVLASDVLVMATPICWVSRRRSARWCSSGSTPSSARPTTRGGC